VIGRVKALLQGYAQVRVLAPTIDAELERLVFRLERLIQFYQEGLTWAMRTTR